MKNAICIILSLLTFWNCQNESIENVQSNLLETNTSNNITYPLSASTRNSSTFNTDWETINQITLPSGIPVYTPWNPECSKNTIPTDYCQDIKKEDGWNLIAHTINGVEKDLNYLFFHNQYTGILKVFYYLEHSYSQTTGLWHVHIDRPQNLLAFTNSFANPINHPEKIQDVYCSNITINQDKAFTEGWNCFELELAYDPSFTSAIMTIEPCGVLQSNLEISGNYNSTSSGTIITLNNNNNGVIKGSGKDAKDYILTNIPKGNLSSGINTSDLSSSSSVADIIKKGVSKLFKSFTGKTKESKPQEYKLQFTTNGSVTLNGSITTNLGGGFSPISIDISENRVGKLGVWNLSNQPEIQFNTLGRLFTTSETEFPIFRTYGAGKELYSPVYNSIDGSSYSFSYNIFTGSHNGCTAPHGSLEGGMNYNGQGALIYDGLYNRQAVEFKVYFPGRDNHDKHQIPGMIYLYGSKGENTPFGISNKYIFRVTLTINHGDQQITLTKSFIPKLEWRTDNLEMNKNSVEDSNAEFILQRY